MNFTIKIIKFCFVICVATFLFVNGNNAYSQNDDILDDWDLISDDVTEIVVGPSLVIVPSAYDSTESITNKAHETEMGYSIVEPNLLSQWPNDYLAEVPAMIIDSNPIYDFSGDFDMGTVIGAREMVDAGGTLVTSGKSSAFAALLGGAAGPKFYSLSGLPRPYGASPSVVSTVFSRELRERLGRLEKVTLTSALPQRDHSLIRTEGSAAVLAAANYLFEDILYDAGGPYWDVYWVAVHTAVEYSRGSNGGKVVYVNSELCTNYDTGGTSRALVDALLDPPLYAARDKNEITGAVGGGVRGNVMTSNLNMVVYNGGITVPAGNPGSDVSYVFTVGERKSNSLAPEIDTGGEPELILSLYDAGGNLCATRRVAGDERTVSVPVSASDNAADDLWTFSVEQVSGIDGKHVVLVACVDGSNDIGEPYVLGGRKMATRPLERVGEAETPYPRGIKNGVFYHQLGDRRATVEKASMVGQISFGALIKPEDVKAYRVDDDLVLDVAGTEDRVTVSGWFTGASAVKAVAFSGKTTISAAALANSAVRREPEIVFAPFKAGEIITGTDGDDDLSYDGDKDVMFIAGKGDDTITGSEKSGNIFYYRKGEGHDTIVLKKGAGKLNVVRFHSDVASGDVTAAQIGNDLKLDVAGDGSVTIRDWFRGNPLDRVEFSGGTVWDTRDLETLARGEKLAGRELYIVPATVPFRDVAEESETSERAAGGGPSAGGCNTGALCLFAGMAAIAFAYGMFKKK